MMSRRVRNLLVSLVALAPGSACGATDVTGTAGFDVSIDVDRTAGGVFAAEGRAVDDGLFCSDGRAPTVGFTDPAGSPLSLGEFEPLRSAAIDAVPPDLSVGYLLEVQFACADGSGAITLVVEECDAGLWEVVSGTGAYRSLVGSGTVEVERDPPIESWHPPGGVPHWNHLSGTLRPASG